MRVKENKNKKKHQTINIYSMQYAWECATSIVYKKELLDGICSS